MNPVSDAVIAENVSYTKWYSCAIPNDKNRRMKIAELTNTESVFLYGATE